MSRLESSLTRVGRAVLLAALGAFTCVVLLLALSALRSEVVTLPIKWAMAAMALVAIARPRDGLLVVAGLAPFGQVAARLFGTEMRGAEAVVLSCLSGALIRAWWSGRVRRFPSGRLEVAAAVLALVVVASCVEQLWFLQLQRHFPREFLADLWVYASGEYLWTFRGLGMVYNTMLILEGLALLVWTADCSRGDPVFRRRLVGMLVISAAAAALLNPAYATEVYLSRRLPGMPLLELAMLRWTVHVGDVNAAGSYFVLMAFLAGGLAVARGWRGIPWLVAAALVVVAGVGLTGSRTAFAAVLLVLVLAGAISLVRSRARPIRALLVGAVVAAPLVFAIAYRLSFRTPGERALVVRWHMLDTAIRMVKEHPLWGVGIGQYELWSLHFASPALREIFGRRENAHNNFAQLAGELGLVGFVPFLVVLAMALLIGMRAARTDILVRAALLGLAAFLATWLGGHPMIVAAAAYPFWIVLGMVVGAGLETAAPADTRVPAVGSRWLPAVPLAALAAALAMSLPGRVEIRKEAIWLPRISYGFHNWEEGPSGDRFRWTGPRARFHVPPEAVRVSFRVRGNAVSPDNPIDLEVLVDGRPASRVRVESSAWQTVRLALPDSASVHAVDLLPSRSWVPAEVFEGSTDTRQLGVQVSAPVFEPAGAAPPRD